MTDTWSQVKGIWTTACNDYWMREVSQTRATRPVMLIMLTLVAITSFSLLPKLTPKPVTCHLRNRSSVVVSSATIVVYGREYQFANLEPGASASFSFRLGGDAHYSVAVKFASGRELSGDAGYLTSGANLEDALIIKDADIQYEMLRTRLDQVNGRY